VLGALSRLRAVRGRPPGATRWNERLDSKRSVLTSTSPDEWRQR